MADAEAPQKLPEENRENIQWWLKFISGAKKAAGPSWEATKDAWCEYEKGEQDKNKQDSFRCFPIYWSSCETLYSAYYGQDPKPVSRRRFGITDTDAMTAALIQKRLGQYFMETAPIFETMRACVGSLIHGAKATTQIITVSKPVTKRVNLRKNGEEYSPEEGGDPYKGEVFQEGEEGAETYYGNTEVQEVDEISLAPVCHDEIIHTPEAKSEDEMQEKAYYFRMDYDDAKRRFPNVPEHCFKNSKTYERGKDEAERGDIPGRYLDGWECYCKKTRMVYWVCESYKDDFLDKQPDPTKFRGFFPSPKFAIVNKPEKSMYPMPAYVHLEPTIEKLHELYKRKFDLIDAIERIILVDGSEPELISALQGAKSGKFYALQNLKTILDKGGIEKCVFVVPLKDLVDAISEINALEEGFSQHFYEWFGVPDILRGVSDPQEALGSQEIKADSASDRFRTVKRMVQELARDSLEMMIDLAVEVFPPERIAKMVGIDFVSPENQQRFMNGLMILKDDEIRTCRVDFETNATSFRDEAKELAKAKMISDTLVNGLAVIGGMQHREFLPPVLNAFLSVLEKMDASEDFQDSVVQSVKQLQQVASQPPPQPPDHEMMKIEVQKQGLDLKAQKDQADNAAKQRDLDQKEFKLGIDAKEKEHKQSMDELKTAHQQQLDGLYYQLDQFKVRLDELEHFIEEKRLALEANTAATQAATTRQKAQETQVKTPKAAAPPVNIHINAGNGQRP